MSIHTVDNCSACLNPLGKTYIIDDPEDGRTLYVTIDLHRTSSGIAHKIHRICVFEWFQEQIFDEPPGKNPFSPEDPPFTCPLCRERISVRDAEQAAGVPLADLLEASRKEKMTKIFLNLVLSLNLGSALRRAIMQIQ